LLEQLAEARQRLAMAAEHQATGCVPIEPVRERRAARQAESQCVETVLQTLAAFGAAMHVDASRLVDHQHQAVAVKQAREDFVWSHLFLRVIPGRREAPDPESITGIWIPGSLAPLAPRNDQGCLSYRNRYHGPAMNENTKLSWWK